MVSKYIGSAVLETIDSNQFGAIPNSSTLHALISMMHTWAQATDGTSSLVRVVCLDYRKASDLVDHGILAAKILGLRIPRGIARWVCDFLMDRRQRMKLSSNCFSKWGTIPSGVPQGTRLGRWLFILMISDLHWVRTYGNMWMTPRSLWWFQEEVKVEWRSLLTLLSSGLQSRSSS